MTVSSLDTFNQFVPDGVEVNYSITFNVIELSQIKAQVDGVDISSTVSSLVSQTVTFNEPPNGEVLTIYRVTPLVQDTDYVEYGPFPAESHEQTLDKIVMMVQEDNEGAIRSVRVPLSDPNTAPLLLADSELVDRANKYLVFNGDGSAIVGALVLLGTDQWILHDEDDMVSDDPNNPASQSSVKAFTENRVRWPVSAWVPGSYAKHDMVKDGSWTMIANKATSDRPAPQDSGMPFYQYDGASPEAPVSVKQIVSGQRYTLLTSAWIVGYRVNIILGNHYTVYTVADPLGVAIINQISDFTADSTGWLELSVTRTILQADAVFDLVVVISEPDPAPTTWNGNWVYTTPQNASDPAVGVVSHANNALDQLRFHKTDSNAGDRAAELLALTPGDIIDSGTGIRWSIQNVADAGTFVVITVAPASQSGGIGDRNFIFETIVATPITRVEDVDYWLGNANVSGLYIEDDGYGSIALNDNAYGVDMYLQAATVSPDWDLVASGDSVGGAAPVSSPIAYVVDRKPNGVHGGISVKFTWTPRDLNSIEFDDSNLVTVANNEVTLVGAGRYRIKWICPMFLADGHTTRLYNVSTSAVIGDGTSAFCSADANEGESQNTTHGQIQETFTAGTVIRVEYYTNGDVASANNLGVRAASGSDEMYSTLEIIKEG